MTEDKLIVLIDGEVSPGRDMFNPHRMEPVDEPSSPFGSRQLESPKGSGLTHDIPTLINHHAEEKTRFWSHLNCE